MSKTSIKRIDKLTPEQLARIPEWVAKWTAIGLNTERADRPKFEAAVIRCYTAAGMAPPRRIVWVPSPLVMALAAPIAAHLLRDDVNVSDSVDMTENAFDSLRYNIISSVGAAIDTNVDTRITANVRRNIGNIGIDIDYNVDANIAAIIRNRIYDNVDSVINIMISDSVRASIRNSVVASVEANVDVNIGTRVHNNVHASMNDNVRTSLRKINISSIGNNIRDRVSGDVVANILDNMDTYVGVNVDTNVGAAVNASVRDSIDKNVDKKMRIHWHDYIGGQFWVGGWHWGSPSYVSFFREVCGLDLGDDMNALAQAHADTASSACWWWPHHDFVMVCERPHMITRDERGRLHSDTGPACGWDGWGVYAVHGVRVQQDVIEHPELITIARIEAENNAEVRRVMISRYGQVRYLRDCGAEKIHTDECGTLWRKTYRNDEPIIMVEVLNSTPEPDGSTKTYFLRVNPTLRPMLAGQRFGVAQTLTARNAIASTFGLTGEEYHPEVET